MWPAFNPQTRCERHTHAHQGQPKLSLRPTLIDKCARQETVSVRSADGNDDSEGSEVPMGVAVNITCLLGRDALQRRRSLPTYLSPPLRLLHSEPFLPTTRPPWSDTSLPLVPNSFGLSFFVSGAGIATAKGCATGDS
jgi:hypothetical protein